MTIDVDFRSYLLDDAALAAITTVVAQNYIPQEGEAPYVWFQIANQDEPVDMSGVGGIVETRLSVECVSTDLDQAQSMANRIKALCNGHSGFIGSTPGTNVQAMFVEDAADDYQPINQFEDDRFSIVSLDIQVFHD